MDFFEMFVVVGGSVLLLLAILAIVGVGYIVYKVYTRPPTFNRSGGGNRRHNTRRQTTATNSSPPRQPYRYRHRSWWVRNRTNIIVAIITILVMLVIMLLFNQFDLVRERHTVAVTPPSPQLPPLPKDIPLAEVVPAAAVLEDVGLQPIGMPPACPEIVRVDFSLDTSSRGWYSTLSGFRRPLVKNPLTDDDMHAYRCVVLKWHQKAVRAGWNYEMFFAKEGSEERDRLEQEYPAAFSGGGNPVIRRATSGPVDGYERVDSHTCVTNLQNPEWDIAFDYCLTISYVAEGWEHRSDVSGGGPLEGNRLYPGSFSFGSMPLGFLKSIGLRGVPSAPLLRQASI